jgi:hypothetical protein
MLQKIPTEILRCQRIQQLIREPFKPFEAFGLFANHHLQFNDRYEQMNSPANRVIGERCPNLSKMNDPQTWQILADKAGIVPSSSLQESAKSADPFSNLSPL